MFRDLGFNPLVFLVHADSGIREPKDLIGRRVGTPEYQMTAAVWIRGILAEHHGVPVDAMTYFTGGAEQPGRAEKLKLHLPPNIKVERIGPGQTLSRMLRDGEIDALYTARTPSTFHDGSGKVRRLFPDYGQVEREYHRQTGIFPIMHVVVMRREVYEANRWIAQSLFKAFREAQRRTYEDLKETAALKAMVPWLMHDVEEARELMGEDDWSYGYENNMKTFEVFLRYHYECGLSKRLLKPEELFAPETLEEFKI